MNTPNLRAKNGTLQTPLRHLTYLTLVPVPPRRVRPWLSLFLLLTLSTPIFASESNIIAPGETLQKLASDFTFTEGPASDADGNVFFTDQPNDRILKWNLDGKL